MSNSLDKLISKDELLTYLCLTIGIINAIYIFIIMINDIKHNMALILLFEFLFLIFIISFLLKKRDVYNKDDDIKYDWYFYLRISIIIIAFLCFVLYIKYLLIDSAINKKRGGAGTTSRFNSSNFFSSSIKGTVAKLYKKFFNKTKYLETLELELKQLNNELIEINNQIKKSEYNKKKLILLEKIKLNNYTVLMKYRSDNREKIISNEENIIIENNRLKDKYDESINALNEFIKEVNDFNEQYQGKNKNYLQIQKEKIEKEIKIKKDKITTLKTAENEKNMKKSSNKIHPEQTLVETSQPRDTTNASGRLFVSNTSSNASETQSVSNASGRRPSTSKRITTQKGLPPLNVSKHELSLIEEMIEPSQISPISPISPQLPLDELDILSPEDLNNLQKFNAMMNKHLTGQSSKLPHVDDEMLRELSILSSPTTKPPTLENRIDIYNIVNKKLKVIKKTECLKKNSNGKNVLSEILTLSDDILGKGVAGKVYISEVKDTQYNVALKLMKKTRDNKNETIIMTRITQQILLNKHSKHFTLFYNNYECDTTNDETSLISVSELTEGDLDKLLKSSEFFNNVDDMVNNLYNLLVQCIVSLGTFHNFGYIHQDSHLKNFLYQTNYHYEEGYYEYKSNNDKTFYIKSCRYNIMLSDFGFSKLPQTFSTAERQAEDMIIILQSIIYFYRDNKDFSEKIKTDINLIKFIKDVSTLNIYLRDSDKSKYNFINLLNKLYDLVPPEILSNDIVETVSINILNKQVFDMTIKDCKIYKK
jgi:hypothetical protein